MVEKSDKVDSRKIVAGCLLFVLVGGGLWSGVSASSIRKAVLIQERPRSSEVIMYPHNSDLLRCHRPCGCIDLTQIVNETLDGRRNDAVIYNADEQRTAMDDQFQDKSPAYFCCELCSLKFPEATHFVLGPVIPVRFEKGPTNSSYVRRKCICAKNISTFECEEEDEESETFPVSCIENTTLSEVSEEPRRSQSLEPPSDSLFYRRTNANTVQQSVLNFLRVADDGRLHSGSKFLENSVRNGRDAVYSPVPTSVVEASDDRPTTPLFLTAVDESDGAEEGTTTALAAVLLILSATCLVSLGVRTWYSAKKTREKELKLKRQPNSVPTSIFEEPETRHENASEEPFDWRTIMQK